MKKILFTFLMISITAVGFSQITNQGNVKKIEVTGLAEMEIIPDEIYLRITLKEYKNGSKTKSINSLESNLVKAVERVGIDKNDLRVDNVYGYNWNWKKKRSDEFLASKSFRLKLNDVKKVNELLKYIDSEGLNNVSIAEVNHSNIDQLKIDLKIKALKNAKDKAGQLLTAINEKLGKTIEVQELNYGSGSPVMARSNMMMSARMESDSYQSNLDFKNISLKAEIRAVFEIE